MSFCPSTELEAEVRELLTHYPQKRSASLMVLHAIQNQCGYISKDAVEWTAQKLGLQPINVFELVTFYPMFRQQPPGQYVFKICRTLSCALNGSKSLHKQLCDKFGLNPTAHGLQTSRDGKFSVEFVECLASCGTAPAVMVNDEFHDGVTREKMEQIVASLK